MNKKVPFWIGIRHTILVYIGNWIGTLLVAYFFGYLSNLLGTPQYRSYLNELVLGKLEGPSTLSLLSCFRSWSPWLYMS
jgi:formate/nitrite transporter FocA (FNT family)